MDLNLKDKVFVVTGGANGIGAEVCKMLGQEGAKVVVVDRSEDSLKLFAQELKEFKVDFISFAYDLSFPENSRKIIDGTIEHYGRLDGVVNNAGVNDGKGLLNTSPESFRESVLFNLGHYYDMVHFSVNHLKKTKGSIVNVSSKTALTGQGGTSAYVASKGAQLSLTREWAVELAPYGIRVNAVIPAEVHTKMYDNWLQTFDDPDAKLKTIVDRIPFEKRRTSSFEMASTIVFLLSERSSHTTGQWIHVDGGYVHLDRAIN